MGFPLLNPGSSSDPIVRAIVLVQFKQHCANQGRPSISRT
ncbi:hypothetical protein COLO4_11576 [Corchorus olitorius]|uniref:Uncharacterized protein n=1 Tax=Corchorus olitorius TaxID=93759 RepID=A0A1R3K4B1_9ROSI|nr:hypothetical protein COLO4_11576 [Corchorus olitorius]